MSSSTPSAALPELRQRITGLYRRDEAACVADLLAAHAQHAPAASPIRERARALVSAVRAQRTEASGVDHLMHEFSLSSEEGVALMCVAEALLRIPDAATADRLIRDKLAQGAWEAHLGKSHSLFVNAATWGLMITGKLVTTRNEEALGNAFGQLLARCGEPVIRKATELAMQLLGRQFVMGEAIDAALERSEARVAHGYTHSFDMLGEAALTAADAERFFDAYNQAIHAIGKASNGRGIHAGPGISVKLSALHPRYCRAQRERVMAELLPRLARLVKLAMNYDIGINIDAEEADRLDLSLDLLHALMHDPLLEGWNGLGFVVQAYQKRAPAVIDYLVALAHESGRGLMIRLVKGAYWDSEIKRAQIDGLAGYPVFTRKSHADLCYLVCARKMLAAAGLVYPQFATHNALSLASVEQIAAELGVTHYEFQCLHGMGEPLYDQVVSAAPGGHHCRIYAPVGSYETLLPYLVRRLLENGSNSSFVNQIVDAQIAIDSLIADPVPQIVADQGRAHPAIALPQALYGAERENSRGLDLSDEATLDALDHALDALAERRWSAAPMLANARCAGGEMRAIHNPARLSDVVGACEEARQDDIESALAAASAFAPQWHATDASTRAAALRDVADLLEAHRDALISLCIREAGKTRANAIAEIREATDFCRYYAAQLERLGKAPNAPGPVVCISPWNFPLAIFSGGIAAALAAGSPVIAKPAEQTPLIAALAVELFHRAGIPRAALQLLPGRGETVGAALVGDARVRGIVFTGSGEVARDIQRRAAPGGARLIAETGGQNAMIVDSSAHLEQVVLDVLASAFDSAGQRCSALRVLCVQEEIADRLGGMLRAAMRELRIGDPAELATDVGPVIDADALSRLKAHVLALAGNGRACFQLPLPIACAEGHFMSPTLLEIGSLDDLRGEVFGPVLHVLRFSRRKLGHLIARINATGFGLTCGLHTRIDETVAQVQRLIHAGNLYVNRNMVGAVVGVQPFGGEGLSGTGPKAGGPFYLPRLMASGTPPLAMLGFTPAAAQGGAVDAAGLLASLTAWAQANPRPQLARLCADYTAHSPLGQSLRLPGPTGERNTLWLAPRGTLWCCADSADALLEQIVAVLASGNRVLLDRAELARVTLASLPLEVRHAVQTARSPLLAHELSGVLFAGNEADAAALRERLAAREGALLPCFTAEAGRYPLYRMVHERVLSVNTTAAGGNTSLMMLGEG